MTLDYYRIFTMLHNIKAFPKLLRFLGTTSRISPAA